MRTDPRWPTVALRSLLLSICITTVADPVAAGPAGALDGRPFFFALSVEDVDRSVAWYTRTLGFEPVRSVDLTERGIRIRLLRREGAFLELTESTAARDPRDLDPPVEKRYLLHGVFKFGFLVGDLADAIARLESLEISLRGEVITEPDGSMRSLQVEDPDGNVIQVFEIVSKTESGKTESGKTESGGSDASADSGV